MEPTVDFDTLQVPDSAFASAIVADPVEQPVVEPVKNDTPPAPEGDEVTPPVVPAVEPIEGEETLPVETAKIKVGDNEYTEDEITAALDNTKNKTDWAKKNTEEAQKNASMRKQIEPVMTFLKKLKSDGEFGDTLRDSMIDRFGDEVAETVDAVLAFDESEAPNPFKDDLASEKGLREAAEYKVFVMEEKATFGKEHKMSPKKVDEVWAYAEKLHETNGEVHSLESAFKLMDYDTLKKRVDAPPVPKVPKVPVKAPGATELKTARSKTFEGIPLEAFKDVME